MPTRNTGARKRPVNLALSESVVVAARAYSDNLSATVDALLAEYVANQSQARSSDRQWADAYAADWNAVHAAVGSFADEHSTL